MYRLIGFAIVGVTNLALRSRWYMLLGYVTFSGMLCACVRATPHREVIQSRKFKVSMIFIRACANFWEPKK